MRPLCLLANCLSAVSCDNMNITPSAFPPGGRDVPVIVLEMRIISQREISIQCNVNVDIPYFHLQLHASRLRLLIYCVIFPTPARAHAYRQYYIICVYTGDNKYALKI